MLVWLEHTCENIHGDCTLNSSTVTGKDVFFKKRILLNPTLEVSSNKISSHVPPQFCHSRDLTLQLIDELLVEAEANWGENRWFVWIGGYWFCVQLSQGLNFSEISEPWIITGKKTTPKTTKLDERNDIQDLCRHNFGHHVVQSVLEHGHEKHRKVVANILKADLLSFAKHRNASYLVEKALSYCAVEASIAPNVAGSDKTSPFKSHLSKPIARVYFSNMWFTNKNPNNLTPNNP